MAEPRGTLMPASDAVEAAMAQLRAACAKQGAQVFLVLVWQQTVQGPRLMTVGAVADGLKIHKAVVEALLRAGLVVSGPASPGPGSQ